MNVSTTLNKVVLKVLFANIGLILSSYLYVPLYPVPATLQTMTVSLICYYYSTRESFISVLSYLTIGIFGFGVFANFGKSSLHLLGPTGGYLFGMLVSTFIIPKLINIFPNNTKNLIIVFFLSHLIMLSLGFLRLTFFVGYSNAFYTGFLIFLPVEFFKALTLGLILGGKIKKNNLCN